MGEPSFYANRRFQITRDGEPVAVVAGDRVDPADFARSLRRDIEAGRIIRIEADGTAKGQSYRMALRLGISVKPELPKPAKPPATIRKRFVLERNKTGLATKVEYRTISGPGAVAPPDLETRGGREGEAGDRPSATEPQPRRRNIVDRVLGRNGDDDTSTSDGTSETEGAADDAVEG